MQALASGTRVPENGLVTYTSKRLGAHDPWQALCHRCALEDCIRNEGDFQAVPPRAGCEYPGCAVWEAAVRGMTPAEALARGEEIGLLDEPA